MKIPKKKVLGMQVIATVLIAVIVIIGFFTPIFSFKTSANGLSVQAYENYLKVAYEDMLEDATSAEERARIEEQFEEYWQFLASVDGLDESGEGLKFGISPYMIVSNAVGVVNLLGNYENEDLSEIDFSRLSSSVLLLSFWFESLITNVFAPALMESGAVTGILLMLLYISMAITCFTMYITAMIFAIIIIIWALKNIRYYDVYFDRLQKFSFKLVIIMLITPIVIQIIPNTSIASGGRLVLYSGIGYCIFIMLSNYLQKTSALQIKRSAMLQAVGICAVILSIITLSLVASADVSGWLNSEKFSQLFTEIAIKNSWTGEYLLAKTLGISFMQMFLDLLNLLLVMSIIVAFAMTTMKLSEQNVNAEEVVGICWVAVIVTMLPYLLLWIFYGITKPEGIFIKMIISWISAGLMVALSIVYKKVLKNAILIATSPKSKAYVGTSVSANKQTKE